MSEDCIIIFRPWIRHPKTGEKVYPRKGKVFPIKVKKSK
jgi:hypothetical protein